MLKVAFPCGLVWPVSLFLCFSVSLFLGDGIIQHPFNTPHHSGCGLSLAVPYWVKHTLNLIHRDICHLHWHQTRAIGVQGIVPLLTMFWVFPPSLMLGQKGIHCSAECVTTCQLGRCHRSCLRALAYLRSRSRASRERASVALSRISACDITGADPRPISRLRLFKLNRKIHDRAPLLTRRYKPPPSLWVPSPNVLAALAYILFRARRIIQFCLHSYLRGRAETKPFRFFTLC